LLRRDFPQSLAIVTALFTFMLVISGGLGSALAYPLAQWADWRFSLASWGIPALVALLVWLPWLRKHTDPEPRSPEAEPAGIWRSALAWQVSLFMACQSTAFFVMIAWFPSMMSDLQRIDAARSGWILFLYQIAVMVAVLAVPVLIRRTPDQRWIGAACGSLIVLGYGGLLLDSIHVTAWMLLMGLGAGGSLVLAMTLFGLRTSSTPKAVALSGMAQTVGYLMAALTPILVGVIHDATEAWSVPLLLMIGITLLQTGSGYLSGRSRTL
jgi:CP family cyanate transporter-like MFS transporter